MRILLVLTFLLPLAWAGQDGTVFGDDSSVVVLDSKWSKSRQTVERPETGSTGPAPALMPANKNAERNRRANYPPGARDATSDTVDARSAELEKIVQESRAPKSAAVDGFAYRVKVRNTSFRAVEVLFWEYQFTESANPANSVRRQFLCGVKIKPDKEKELTAFSVSGPSNTISAESLAGKAGQLFQGKVVINRVEYADGSIWQRKDWNFAEVMPAIKRAVETPWGPEMCRSL